jgi:pyruvate/2-oxoglutarate dehydrogenase complex dihydrolipoamide acyltransferase (E2) component
MNTEVKVPMFAEGATKIQVRQWMVAVGDKVKAGDSLCEATTDKISIYIEAPKSGYVKSLLVEEDDTVAIDQVIAILSDEPVEK